MVRGPPKKKPRRSSGATVSRYALSAPPETNRLEAFFFDSCLPCGRLAPVDAPEKRSAFSDVPDDPGRKIENDAAAVGNSISPSACRRYGVSPLFLAEWLGGVRLIHSEPVTPYCCNDYPLVEKHSAEAGAELDRLTSLNKIAWYSSDSMPDNLYICPSNIIAKPNRVRLVHDWSHPDCNLNALLLQPDVSYGSLDSWLSNLKPQAFMAGLDLQDCFFHWPIHPDCRRLLGVRRPVSGQLGAYLFLPFGLGPAPGINDRNVKELLRVLAVAMPDARYADFVDDLRITHSSGSRVEVESVLRSTIYLLSDMGFRVHSKPGKLILPTQRISWIGFSVDTNRMEVSIEPEKLEKGKALIQELVRDSRIAKEGGRPLKVRAVSSVAGFLNFLAPIVPGGAAHLHHIWSGINATQVYAAWSAGNRRANPPCVLSDAAVSDLGWWGAMLSLNPRKPILHWGGRSFIWHHKLAGATDLISSAPPERIAVITTDASGSLGRGATWQDRWLSDSWPPELLSKHINWKELHAILSALKSWAPSLRKRVVLIKTDNSAAAAYANRGRGRSDDLTCLARNIKALELEFEFHLVTTHIGGALNVVADALSRGIAATDANHPLHSATTTSRFWKLITSAAPTMEFDAMADDEGINARFPRFASPSFSAFERDLREVSVWWFPPPALIGPTIKHILSC